MIESESRQVTSDDWRNNVFIGYNAGMSVTTGSYNVVLGARALSYDKNYTPSCVEPVITCDIKIEPLEDELFRI